MRREERVTVQGPVKEQQPNGMSHRGGGGLRAVYSARDAMHGGQAGSGPEVTLRHRSFTDSTRPMQRAMGALSLRSQPVHGTSRVCFSSSFFWGGGADGEDELSSIETPRLDVGCDYLSDAMKAL